MDTLITIAGTIAVFMVGREVVCWYWKINDHVKLQAEIRDLLRHQNSLTESFIKNQPKTKGD